MTGYEGTGELGNVPRNILHCKYYRPHEVFFYNFMLDLTKYIPEVSRGFQSVCSKQRHLIAPCRFQDILCRASLTETHTPLGFAQYPCLPSRGESRWTPTKSTNLNWRQFNNSRLSWQIRRSEIPPSFIDICHSHSRQALCLNHTQRVSTFHLHSSWYARHC